MKTFLHDIVTRAGEISLEHRTRLGEIKVSQKNTVKDLVTEAEDRFDISIPLNVLPDVHTVRDFTRQVQALLGGR